MTFYPRNQDAFHADWLGGSRVELRDRNREMVMFPRLLCFTAARKSRL